MFGDAMYDEEERLRLPEDALGGDHHDDDDDEINDVVAAGGLDERLGFRDAIARLLREVGGR